MSTATAEIREAKAEPVPGRRVLVAEDSPITHELLKLLLSQRGHEVDIVTDGRAALEALRSHPYDVALLDFHLPEMDGLQVAAALRREANGRKLPRLIAITADVEGLLSHAEGCEAFDHVIPKPLDIYEVGKLVEEQSAIGDEQAAAQEKAAGEGTVRALPVERVRPPSFLEGLGYEFLYWPGDVEPSRLSPRAMQATLGDSRFDGVVVREPVDADELSTLWRHKALFALPVIDLTGTLGPKADVDASKLNVRDSGKLGQVISRFQDGRARLNRDLLFSDNLGEKLAGRLYVSGSPLTASLDASAKSLITYNVALRDADAEREAEAQCADGLFKRVFFDRFLVCPRCQSARQHVREECSKCRSANLEEESYLHHFRCAYQGPESEFRQGDDLICPKCRRELTHFGYDYDRPGTMIVCRDCRHAASEPAIGFVCLDCGGHADSEACPTRDAFSYELTDEGIRFAELGSVALGRVRKALRFAELPMELVVALNAAAKRYNDEKVPFTLVDILYEKEREIAGEHGARQFAQARDLFIDNMRAVLGEGDLVVKGRSHDFALLQTIEPRQAEAEFDELRERSQASVRYDLGARFQAFGPEDFS